MSDDTLFKQLGFAGAAEFNKMVSNADLSTPAKFAAFKAWQIGDGSKVGLEKLQVKSDGSKLNL